MGHLLAWAHQAGLTIEQMLAMPVPASTPALDYYGQHDADGDQPVHSEHMADRTGHLRTVT